MLQHLYSSLPPSLPPSLSLSLRTCEGPEVGVDVVDVAQAVTAQGQGVSVRAEAWREGGREGGREVREGGVDWEVVSKGCGPSSQSPGTRSERWNPGLERGREGGGGRGK